MSGMLLGTVRFQKGGRILEQCDTWFWDETTRTPSRFPGHSSLFLSAFRSRLSLAVWRPLIKTRLPSDRRISEGHYTSIQTKTNTTLEPRTCHALRRGLLVLVAGRGKGKASWVTSTLARCPGVFQASVHLKVSRSAAERVNALWQEASLATSAGNNALETKP